MLMNPPPSLYAEVNRGAGECYQLHLLILEAKKLFAGLLLILTDSPELSEVKTEAKEQIFYFSPGSGSLNTQKLQETMSTVPSRKEGNSADGADQYEKLVATAKVDGGNKPWPSKENSIFYVGRMMSKIKSIHGVKLCLQFGDGTGAVVYQTYCILTINEMFHTGPEVPDEEPEA
ncbi:hypothetical protein BDZ97DRAFT_1767880 [Flammula alnicola]|nr:hypothetical protein BDZ97DRAFT_1767880 [Flammula alnicola]